MKRGVLFLVLLACTLGPQLQYPLQVESPKVVERIVERLVVQCWDNSTASSIGECPPIPIKESIVTVMNLSGAKFLAQAPRSFDGYAYRLEDRLVLEYKTKARHMFFRVEMVNDVPLTDVYVDLENRTAIGYCNIDRESHIAGHGFDYSRSRCKWYIDTPIPLSFEDWKPHGPVEYLDDFKEEEPSLVESGAQVVSVGGRTFTVSPSIHYKRDGHEVTLRIDKRYHVPIRIEYDDLPSVDFKEIFFDMMIFEGNQYKLNGDWVEYVPVGDFWRSQIRHPGSP